METERQLSARWSLRPNRRRTSDEKTMPSVCCSPFPRRWKGVIIGDGMASRRTTAGAACHHIVVVAPSLLQRLDLRRPSCLGEGKRRNNGTFWFLAFIDKFVAEGSELNGGGGEGGMCVGGGAESATSRWTLRSALGPPQPSRACLGRASEVVVVGALLWKETGFAVATLLGQKGGFGHPGGCSSQNCRNDERLTSEDLLQLLWEGGRQRKKNSKAPVDHWSSSSLATSSVPLLKLKRLTRLFYKSGKGKGGKLALRPSSPRPAGRWLNGDDALPREQRHLTSHFGEGLHCGRRGEECRRMERFGDKKGKDNGVAFTTNGLQ